ncbi:MAG: SCO family protein [Thermoanaerobaculia bacterium]
MPLRTSSSRLAARPDGRVLAAALAAFLALGAGASEAAHASTRVFSGPGLAERVPLPGELNAQKIQERVGFDQRLGQAIPLDLPFVDETGKAVRLGDYFGKKPVLLSFVYFRCPVLCPQIFIGAAAAMKGIPYEPGRDFETVFVSFDPADTPEKAAEKKASTVERYGKPATASGWHFLTGDADAIRQLTAAAGFRYAWDPTIQQFAHASGAVVLTPDGHLARYLYGVEYEPKDLKLALFEAGQGKIGGLAEKLLLLCFNYDAALGKYTVATLLSIKVAATVTLAVLIFSIVWMLRSERRLGRAAAGGVASV